MGLFSIGGSTQELRLYSGAYITIDGNLLSEEASLSVDKKSGLTPMTTLGAGFAGMSLGAALCEVSVDSVVPSTDFEFNPDLYLKTGQTVEVGVIIGGRQTVFKGFITDATYSHAVNKEAHVHMKMMCRFAGFE